MKLQLASDLHLEFLKKRFPGVRLVEPAPDADLLVLAGDIHNGTNAVQMFSSWPVPVIYVAGNHEFYGEHWERTRAALRKACVGTNVRFLDNDSLEIGGVRFLGCTLWTDFRLSGVPQHTSMKSVARYLNDYVKIRASTGMLSTQMTLEDHERSRSWLEAELAKPFEGHTVVVTHMGPHPNSIHPRYAGSSSNAGFVSELTPLLQHVDLWLHGHVHDSFDYPVSGCRVVTNPAGYAIGGLSPAHSKSELVFENKQFNPSLVLDLDEARQMRELRRRQRALIEQGLASGPPMPDTEADWAELDAIARADDAAAAEKRVQRLRSLVQEGLDSGPGTPMAQEDWDHVDAIGRGEDGLST